MEITIDEALVRGILAEEMQQADAEIDRLGPIAAYQLSRVRHDARLSAAPDAHTLACKNGCFWCCYFTVDVRAVEVFGILDFMARELGREEQARVWREIQANNAQLQGLSEMDRMRRSPRTPRSIRTSLRSSIKRAARTSMRSAALCNFVVMT